MTAEYLDRGSLVARMEYYKEHTMEESGEHYAYLVALREIRNAPASDVAPVVHGRWEYIPQTLNTLSQFRCPFCRWWSLDPSIDGAYNYCPNCGAKMDGDE